MTSLRPRRSVLYVPGSNARAMEKAWTLPADGLLFDLEDAVAPAAKESARARVMEALRENDGGHRERVVRINGLGTPWGASDLVAVARSGAEALCLPKVESPLEIVAAATALDAAGAPLDLRIWAMIETPRGVLSARDIASASPRLVCMVAGTSDLVKDLRARHTKDRAEVQTSLSLILLASRAAGLTALDGVHLDISDATGLEASCRQARDMGFDGKTLIHPSQLSAANRIFAPSPEELSLARRIVEAHAEAVAAGNGVTVVDGRLVESLHVQEAERLLALDRTISEG